MLRITSAGEFWEPKPIRWEGLRLAGLLHVDEPAAPPFKKRWRHFRSLPYCPPIRKANGRRGSGVEGVTSGSGPELRVATGRRRQRLWGWELRRPSRSLGPLPPGRPASAGPAVCPTSFSSARAPAEAPRTAARPRRNRARLFRGLERDREVKRKKSWRSKAEDLEAPLESYWPVLRWNLLHLPGS